MNEQKEALIKDLALDVFERKSYVDSLSRVNTYGKSYDERLRLNEQYYLALAELYEAEARLSQALKKP